MESRFSIKDFFVFLLLLTLIGIVVLAMVQYDRQWQSMQQTNRLLTEQTTDLARIRRLLEAGAVQVGAPTTGPTASAVPPLAGFERILKSQAAPDYAQGGQLVLLSQATPSKLTPLIATDLVSWQIDAYMLDVLADRDPNTLAYIPRLAESWTVSPDSLTIDFKLRHGITFSDGSPFTADDVIFTFDLMRDPKIEDPIYKVGTERLDRVEKTGDYSVRFVFKEPYFQSFLMCSSSQILSKAFYSKYSPTDFNRSTGLVLGTGPYRLADPTSWRPEPGQPIVLVRNERYWGPTPSFDRLVWNVVEEPAARVTAFRNGDIDFLGGQNGPPTPEQYDQLSHDAGLLTKTQHWDLNTPVDGYYYIGWNERVNNTATPSPFADVRVRKAMTLLTDRQAILKNIIHGYGAVMSGPFPPMTPQCDPSIKPLPYDPAAAEQLLAEAGFHKQDDRLIGPDGQPLTFKMTYNSNSEQRRRIASLLHDAYAKAGIDAEPDPAEWSVFLKRMDDRQYQVLLGAWGGAIEDDVYEVFHSSQIAGTGEDFIHFSSPEVDAAIEKARTAPDDASGMALWHVVHRLLAEQQPYTFLYIGNELDFLNNRIHGAEPTKVEGLNPPVEWYVPRALQAMQ
jgi:peptide/nickel transport system substrate-binding protein